MQPPGPSMSFFSEMFSQTLSFRIWTSKNATRPKFTNNAQTIHQLTDFEFGFGFMLKREGGKKGKKFKFFEMSELQPPPPFSPGGQLFPGTSGHFIKEYHEQEPGISHFFWSVLTLPPPILHPYSCHIRVLLTTAAIATLVQYSTLQSTTRPTLKTLPGEP